MDLRPVWVGLLLCLAAARAQVTASGPVYPIRVDAVYHGLWQNPDSDDLGQVFMQIIADDDDNNNSDDGADDNGPAPTRPWTIVRGGLILRHSGGIEDAYLSLDGVYTTETGALLLYCNIPDWKTRPEVVHVTQANATAPDAASLQGLQYSQLASSIESCQISMRLNAMPLVRDSQLSFDPVTFETIWRQGSQSMDRITVSGAMHSPNCAFNLTTAMATARSPLFIDRASRFSLMASAAAIAQMLVTLKQIQSAHLGRVSLVTIAILSLLDAYLCVVHIGVGMRVPDLWLSFVILTMIEFLLFSVFQVRLMFMIWKANNRDLFDLASLEERRQLINRLHTRLLAFVLVGLFGIFFAIRNFEAVVTIVLHSPWLPQIIFNLRQNTNRGLLPQYVCVMAFSRLLLPLYKFGDPSNYMDNPLDYTFCYLLLVWVAFQVGVLYLQDRLGPRFCIPAAFKPANYNYFRPVDVADTDICAICMMEIVEDVESQMVPDDGNLMVTPCSHKFHSVCLITWMEQKMECPNCRMSLPPI